MTPLPITVWTCPECGKIRPIKDAREIEGEKRLICAQCYARIYPDS